MGCVTGKMLIEVPVALNRSSQLKGYNNKFITLSSVRGRAGLCQYQSSVLA
jgi:hypothetical protein